MSRLCLCIGILISCLGLVSGSEVAASTSTNSGSPTLNASAYANLQDAIDAIPVSGGTLVIDGQFEAKAGSCTRIAESAGSCIYGRSNIRIRGDGVTSKIFTTSPSTIALMVLASDSIIIEGVEFAGPWMKGMLTDNAVAVYVDVYGTTPSTRITIQNCRVHNFPFDGLWARNGTSQIHFLHNESYDNAWNAIEIEAQDSSVLDNDLHDNRGQGVEVLSAAQRVRVANNWAVRDAVGIKLINQNPPFGTLSEISVVGNNTADNTQDGILYTSTGTGDTPSGLITITGNTSVGNAHDGISLYQAGVGITVSDNIVSSNVYADISIAQVSDVVVSNNILTALPGTTRAANGILITPDSVRIHVLNNAVDGY